MPPINRTQALVLGFVVVVLAALVAILFVDAQVYDAQIQSLGLSGNQTLRVGFVASVSALIAVLAVGTIRRWRWAFWVVLVAFAAGVLRVPVFGLQLLGIVPFEVPLWYAGLQTAIGLAQVAIAVALWRGYRRAGPWGAF